MSRTSRLLAATLAAAALALPAVADARVVSASFEARFVVVATCSVSVGQATGVAVDCANAATPWMFDAAPSLRQAGPDPRRVTVYF